MEVVNGWQSATVGCVGGGGFACRLPKFGGHEQRRAEAGDGRCARHADDASMIICTEETPDQGTRKHNTPKLHATSRASWPC